MENSVYIVIPNWNGIEHLTVCLDSLKNQTEKTHIIVVDNGSVDGSVGLLRNDPVVELIELDKNYGFAGGVNAGIQQAMKANAEYVGLFNNDAVADKDWLKHLKKFLDNNKGFGAATCSIIDSTQQRFDSTGDFYTTWGLPFARGRNELVSNDYRQKTIVFGASGGASVYRVEMLQEIGLFDEDFFAYYEDVDISFRAQLAGWKVAYVPDSKVFHRIGATSKRIHGFTTYQTMKNLPILFWKNVPAPLLAKIFIRFLLAYTMFFLRAFQRGEGWPATKGFLKMLTLLPKKLIQRYSIQKNKKVSTEYVRSILVYDLPPNALKLRALRDHWQKLRGKSNE